MTCVCITGSKWYNIVESQSYSGPPGGPYEFKEGEVYEFTMEEDLFWGTRYIVKNGPHQTSFGSKDNINTPPGRSFTDYFQQIS